MDKGIFTGNVCVYHAEMLLIGTGDEMTAINPVIFGHFARNGVAVEHMASVRYIRFAGVYDHAENSMVCLLQKHAISTFNVLNQEGRGVAAAMLCRNHMPRDEACCYLRGSPDLISPKTSNG